MIDKITYLSLLGLTKSTASPAWTSTFPKYAAAAAPTGAAFVGSGGEVLIAYSTSDGATANKASGPIRGFRNDIYAFPTQTLLKAD